MRILLVLIAFVFAGCGESSDDSNMDRIADEMKDVAEELEDVADAVGDAVEDGTEKLGDAYHDALDKAEGVGEVMKKHAEDIEKEIEEAVND
jgi:ElaB/YqjD/DUF883 family membrane-anchored ribosome-binding protein